MTGSFPSHRGEADAAARLKGRRDSTEPKRCAAAPCGTCPYRRDVPSGIWDASEYAKLPGYDGETWQQSPAAFHCHQRDGNLCAGWIACHDAGHLLALRLQPVDPSVFSYRSPVPVFASGAEAAAHGLADVPAPDSRAAKAIAGLIKKRARASLDTLSAPSGHRPGAGGEL